MPEPRLLDAAHIGGGNPSFSRHCRHSNMTDYRGPRPVHGQSVQPKSPLNVARFRELAEAQEGAVPVLVSRADVDTARQGRQLR